jgi:seryl-tRNA synthetase
MSAEESCNTDLRVDVGVLKVQVVTLTQLCNKMDTVIDRLMENQNKMAADIYDDMDKRKQETVSDIKELHSRITTVDRNLSDKIELTERRIMDEIKSLHNTISKHNEKEDSELKKILEWKWMGAGGIVVLAWILSHIKVEGLGKLLGL